MEWLEGIQFLAGAGLVYFGLDELARHTGRLVESVISALSERTRHIPGSSLIVGIPAGVAMQGRRGRDYLRRRRLAGLLTLSQTAGMVIGLGIGMMLPACIAFLAPATLRFPILAAGVILKMVNHGKTWQSVGRALIGLGCCWVGFAACQTSVPENLVLPLMPVAALALVVACLSRTPVPLWLILSSTPVGEMPFNAVIIGVAVIAGWGCSALPMGLWLTVPFSPPDALIDYRELRFPERALQAALQEVRRLATGLASSSATCFPGLMQGDASGYAVIRDVELAMDEFKPATLRFLGDVARRQLSERQAQLLLHLSRCVSDLERIGDHVDALASLAVRRSASSPPDTVSIHDTAMRALTEATLRLMELVAASISGMESRAEAAALRILEQRQATLDVLKTATDTLAREMELKQIPPRSAVRERELLSHFERIIRHVHAIALAEQQPDFWIDPDAVHLRAVLDRTTYPPVEHSREYLHRILKQEAEP